MSPTRDRFPTGLAVMLVAVLSIEIALARHEGWCTTVWALAWKEAARATQHEASSRNILIFGDSLLKQGVAPRVFENHLGLSSYNLALFKGPPAASYFLLRRLLVSGKKPSVVMIDGELLPDDPRALTRLWPELLSWRDLFDLTRTARDADLFTSTALGRVCPSIRTRHELREMIRTAFQGAHVLSRQNLAPVWRNWRQNLGAHIVPTEPSSGGRDRRLDSVGHYLPTTWGCHPLNAIYLDRFLALAATHGIKVCWLLPPIHPEIQHRRERGGYDRIYVEFVERLQRRWPGLVVVDGRRAGYPASALADFTHLNRRGAVVYSNGLAEVLAAEIDGRGKGGHRWVALPPFEERPLADAYVEDLHQSAVVLHEATHKRVR